MTATENTVKRKKKSKKIISFDEEVVTKENAQNILSKISEPETVVPKKKSQKKRQNNEIVVENNSEIESTPQKKKKRKKKPESDAPETKVRKKKVDQETVEETPDEVPKKKKRKQIEAVPETTEGVSSSKKTESKREQKRLKYAKLLEEKKVNTELALQQKALNYLSKWKHSRGDWKFEKLRQIWLQQNMFNSSKIPVEMWETLLEYCNGSKGKSREAVLKEALKIIEDNQEDSDNEELAVKLNRARDVIQNLQE